MLLLRSHSYRYIRIIYSLLLAYKRTIDRATVTHRFQLPLLSHEDLIQLGYLVVRLPKTVGQLLINLRRLLEVAFESLRLLSRPRVLVVPVLGLAVSFLESLIPLQ